MISAFGVEHGVVSKAEKLSSNITPMLPSTTVMAYNNSRYNKKRAAARNFAARAVGSGLGLGAGYLAYKHVPMGRWLNSATKFKTRAPSYSKGKLSLKRKNVKFSSDKKKGYVASAMTSMGAGVGGYIGGKESLQNIKESPRFRYEE